MKRDHASALALGADVVQRLIPHRRPLDVTLPAVALACALAGCAPAVLWTGHTPDRAHRVEVIERDGLQFVVIDGERTAGYTAIAAWSIAMSDDGRHLAYAARRGGRWVVVADGRAGVGWDGIGAIVVGAGGRVAYAAERAGGWHVVIDGGVGPRFDAIVDGTLRFAPDGRRVVYAGSDAAGVRVVDGEPGPAYDGIGQLSIAADGRVGYAARRGHDAFVIVGGASSRAWRAVAQLQLGPAGRVAYAASDGAAWRVVVDGVATAAAAEIRAISFRPDGAHVAWLSRLDELDAVVLDERPVAAAPHIRAATVRFSPAARDAPGLAWVEPTADGGGERVVVDGAAQATFDAVGVPVWSPDGLRLAYTAQRGDAYVVVVDGFARTAGGWTSDPVFSPDSRRVAHVERAGARWAVVVEDSRTELDLVFHDTLTFSADSRIWAAVAGDLARERLFVTLDGDVRIPIATRDVYSAAAAAHRSAELVAVPGDDALLHWAQAEADRAMACAGAHRAEERDRASRRDRDPRSLATSPRCSRRSGPWRSPASEATAAEPRPR